MKLELSIHALHLHNVAGPFRGTSDPFACVTILATTPGSHPQSLGKTEVVNNSLNPKWVKVFPIDYEMGVPLKVAICIYDEEAKGNHKSMGSAVFDIAEVLGARGNTKAKKLHNGGMIFASVRRSSGSGLLRLQIKGNQLKNMEGAGIFQKSDPFFELSRKVDNAGALTWDNVYRSQEIKNNLDPEWEPVVIELSTLCGGDMDSPILIEVLDHESSGKHVIIGKAEVSVSGMKSAAESGKGITIMSSGKDTGTLTVSRCEVSGMEDITTSIQNATISAAPAIASVSPVIKPREPDFVDYISGGCELNVVVAIDFTGSNGDPRQPGTLHHFGPGLNDYEKAITAIVNVIEKYDSDKKIPVLGFGAKLTGTINHCFQVGPTDEVEGVSGILKAYNQVFKTGLVMSRPTVFEGVIDAAAKRACQSLEKGQQKGQQSYTILLIVTDGAVSDPQATAACINRASDAPLSIVIVGVGTDDFSAMQSLDDNTGIVQFVEFNKHSSSSVALTAETLKEIPYQLTAYFPRKDIAPLPALQHTDSIVGFDEVEEEIDLTLDIGEEEIVVAAGGNDFVDDFIASR